MALISKVEVDEYGDIDIYPIGPMVVIDPDVVTMTNIHDEGTLRLTVRESYELRLALEQAEREVAREGWTE